MKKLFKRRLWIKIWEERGTATVRQFTTVYEIASKTIVEVKEKRDGTFKARAYVNSATTGNTLLDVQIDYVLYEAEKNGDTKLRPALKQFGIQI